MEITSLKQKLKIEEIEAQLNEAEDVVTDLRAQLNAVQDEMEKMKKKTRLKPLDEQTSKSFAASHKNSSQANKLKTSETEDQESNLKTGPTTKEGITDEVTCVVATSRGFDVRITEKKSDVMEDEHQAVKSLS
ncbi:hypothetical protein IFM89_032293 [Coptis chinensis]|uniref:Uncharacterized protein n=1 Tax=Coptis chinensis TaxID=261450 RepID=A0A835GZ84_9MAGN|nr:hypothetical protein IFM89_032293 [Coptis chinensis]